MDINALDIILSIVLTALGVKNRYFIGGALGVIKPEAAATKTLELAIGKVESLAKKADLAHSFVAKKADRIVDTRAELSSARALEVERVNAKYDTMHDALTDKLADVSTKVSDAAARASKLADLAASVKGVL